MTTKEPTHRPDQPFDLGAGRGEGPLWGVASEDLNSTLVAWRADQGTPEHVNDERDVLIVLIVGSATIRIDDVEHTVRAPVAVIIPKRSRRRITAGPDGVRYVSAHVVRPPLQIRSKLIEAPRRP
jgi:quercetin dioxygenase-like cupin family protein